MGDYQRWLSCLFKSNFDGSKETNALENGSRLVYQYESSKRVSAIYIGSRKKWIAKTMIMDEPIVASNTQANPAYKRKTVDAHSSFGNTKLPVLHGPRKAGPRKIMAINIASCVKNLHLFIGDWLKK